MHKILLLMVLFVLSLFPGTQARESGQQKPVLNLVEMEEAGTLPQTREIKVAHDIVYKTTARYEGYDLAEVLKLLPDFSKHGPHETMLIFTSTDGYAPAIPLHKALSRQGVIARRDLNAPIGNWKTLKHGKEEITPAPFYMVWESGKHFNEADYPWSYQLASLHLESISTYYGDAYPEDEAFRDGFNLFSKHCMKCHSINMVGGALGPELNVPKNVTEYWREEDMRAFILNPNGYRLRSKMPPHNFFSDREMDALLSYIRSMKEQKMCNSPAHCN